jgi:hypothetical protein
MTTKDNLLHSIIDFFGNGWAALCGFMSSVVGYFLPVKDIVHLLILFFILDVIFGFLSARKLRHEKFDVKIIWNHTMPRMLISIVLITGAFLWDNVYNQDFIPTYKIVGWFISGVLFFSIVQNAYLITNWSVFKNLSILIKSKIEEKTGGRVDEK